jgi:tape measure domain-containing protein
MAQTVVGRVTTIIDADNSRLLAKIKQSTSKLNELSKFKTSISLDLDNKSFSSKISDSSKEISKLGDKKVSLDANNQSLVNKISDSAKEISKLGDKKVSIDANSQSLVNKISDSAKEISKLGDKKVSIDANNQSLVNKISDSAKEISKLGDKKVSIDANNQSLVNKVSDSSKAIKKLSGKSITLNAESKIDSKIKGINNSLKSLKGKSILLTAKDNIKAIVNKGVNSIKRLKNKSVLLSARDQVSAKVTKLSKKVNGLKGKTIPINVKTANANKKIEDLGKSANKTSSSLRGMFKGISFVAISAGVVSLTKKILDLTIAAEQTEVAFQSLLGSDVSGSRLFNEIIQLAAVTPFTSSRLNEAAKTLLAFGTEGEDVVGILRQIGDVSAATGADIRNLALVFGQIQSTGKLMGQDLNQLINAGFNPLQVISEKTGRSMADLKDDMAAGLITFSDVEDAFKDVTSEGGKFFKMMERQSATVGGRLSTLRDNLQQIGRNLGEIAAPALETIVENLNKAAKTLAKVTAGEGTAGEKAAVGGTVGIVGLASTLIGVNLLGKAIGQLGKAISGTSVGSKKLSWRIRLLGKVIAEMRLVRATKLFGSIFSRLMTKILSVIGPTALLTKVIPQLVKSLVLAATSIGGLIVGAIAGALFLINKFNKGDANLIEAFVFSIKGLFNLLKTGISAVGSFGKSIVKVFRTGMGTVFTGIKAFFTGIGTIFTGIKASITGLFKPVIDFIDLLSQPLQDLGKGLIEKFGLDELATAIFDKVKGFGNALIDALGLDVLKEALVGADGVFKDFNSGIVELSENFANFISFGWFKKLNDDLNSLPMKNGVIDFGIQSVEVEQLRAKIPKRKGLKEAAAKKAAEEAKRVNKEIEDFTQEGLTKYIDALFPKVNLKMNIMDAKSKLEKMFKKNSEKTQDAIFDLQEMMNEMADTIPEDIAAGISDIEGEVPDIFKGIDFTKLFSRSMSPEEIISQIPEGSLPSFVDILAKILEKPLKKLKEGFSDFGAEIDISDALLQIENNKVEFSKAFEKFAGKGIFKGIDNIEEALGKIPKELIPDFVSLLEKEIDSADTKIKSRFDKFTSARDIKEAREDILENKIFYEPLLAEFGFDSFEQAFLEIPKKLLPEFRDVLKNAAPDFSARLSQIGKNLDIFDAKLKIQERFKKDNLGDLVDIPLNKIELTLDKLIKQAPEEDLPAILD